MSDDIYIIDDNPTYKPEIRKLKNSDPANADTIFNPLFSQIINNVAAVKKTADSFGTDINKRIDELSEEDNNINSKIENLSNVAKSGSYNDLTDKPKSLERTRLTKANDLNNVKEAGGYYFVSSDVPQNVPQGLNNNCVLDVSYSKDINTIIQILYKLLGGIPEIYIRRCLNSSWSDWLKYSNDSVSMNYNNLSNKPASLPASGGDADTVDGKHSDQFVKYDSLGQETDLRSCVSEGVYKCSAFYDGETYKGGSSGNRNMPGGGDGQATLVVHFYNGNTTGYIGKDSFWLNQIVYRPGRHPYFRYVSGTSISGWIELKDLNISVSRSVTSGTKTATITINGTNYDIYYNDTDTKNTAGSSNSTSKLYLTGATSQSSTGVTTYSNSGCYIQSSSLYSGSSAVLTQANKTSNGVPYYYGTTAPSSVSSGQVYMVGE